MTLTSRITTRCYIPFGTLVERNTLIRVLFTVIWRQTYGKGPFRERERKPAAAT